MQESRFMHYVFAHIAMPQVFFADPQRCLALLRSSKADELLHDLADKVAADCAEQGHPVEPTMKETVVHSTHVGVAPCCVLEFPEAIGVPEAHYAALILPLHFSADGDCSMTAAPQFLTLERGVTTEDEVCTFLCGWTADGVHQNYGPGLDATIENFLAAINERFFTPETAPRIDG